MWTWWQAWRAAAIRTKGERDEARLTEKERDVMFLDDEGLRFHEIVLFSSDTRMEWMERMYEECPERLFGIDRQVEKMEMMDKRTVLHCAVIGNWSIEAIAWLIEKFPNATGMKDCDGFTPITYGVLYGRCDEIILQMAIPVAKMTLNDAKKMYDINNYEGCKRLFNKTTQDVLSGVPNFDHCHVQAALELYTKSACDEILEYWSDFIAKWGYFDPPHLIEDLVPKKRVILGSHATLTVVAKGEPLSYQWYCDGDILNGCTQATLDITQSAQAEDEGEYYCRVTNWRGSVNSTTTTIIVIDDTIVVDPSTRYYYPKDKLLRNESLFTVKATTGDVLMCEGIQLLIPPQSFQVLDLFDCNLAETTGMDIVMQIDSQPYENASLPKLLSTDEWFVSPLVSLKPTKLDPFLTPWTCRIPHSSVALERSGLEIVVLQIVPIDMEGNFAYSDVPMSQCRVASTFVDIDLLELGTFVVIQRRCSHDDAITKQRMSITLAMLKDVEIKLNSTIDIHAWVCPTRLDCMEKMTSIVEAEKSLIQLTVIPIEVTGQMELSMRLNRDVVKEQLNIGCMKFLGIIPLQLSPKLFQQNYNGIVADLEIALHRGSTCENSFIIQLHLPLIFPKCHGISRVRLNEHNKYSVQVSWSSPAQQHPSYVIVELAPFSKTFWDRYKDIWWFERGNLSIIQRLYRVAHKEITGGNSATIYTDVHAAAMRVAIFSQDHTTNYSDPVLLTPETLHDNEDEMEVKSNGLESMHVSTLLHSDHSDVIELISVVYSNSRVFNELYGVSPESVISLLDSNKTKIRSCHYATALLLTGLVNLDKIAMKVPFHRPSCVFFTKTFGLLDRFIPALDIAYGNDAIRALVQRLHCTLRDLFIAVRECISPTWFTRFLLADAQAFQDKISTILEATVSETKDLFPSEPIAQALLMQWENARHAFFDQQVASVDPLIQQHAWSLLSKGPISPSVSNYLSHTFEMDMTSELKSLDTAIQAAAEANTLSSKILGLYPRSNDSVEHTSVIHVRFGGDVIDVDCLRFITLKNISLGVRVNGSTTFDKLSRSATFTPTVALEARTTFKLKLRAEAVTSWIGPLRQTIKYTFTTKPK